MMVRNGAPAPDALHAVQQLETALGARTGAGDTAAAGLDAARAAAERLLADARTAGTDAGSRRRAELLAEAEDAARTIRAAGQADADALRERVSADRVELIAELTALLLPEA